MSERLVVENVGFVENVLEFQWKVKITVMAKSVYIN